MTPSENKGSKEIDLPKFECTKCGACCKDTEILVTVTDGDILRISRTLELAPNEMLRALDFYITEPDTPPPTGLEKIPAIQTERGLAYVALKKMENGDCIFLKDDQCMIHPIRPMVCRSFPFVFSVSNNQRNWGLSAKQEICPGLGTGSKVSKTELDSLAKEVLTDFEAYRKFADSWNSRSESCNAFDFINEILSMK